MTKLRQTERARRRLLASRQVTVDTKIRCYHGGRAGLMVGEFILPVAETGDIHTKRLLEEHIGEAAAEDILDVNRVYFTTDINWASCTQSVARAVATCTRSSPSPRTRSSATTTARQWPRRGSRRRGRASSAT
jgi:hypothetical protein